MATSEKVSKVASKRRIHLFVRAPVRWLDRLEIWEEAFARVPSCTYTFDPSRTRLLWHRFVGTSFSLRRWTWSAWLCTFLSWLFLRVRFSRGVFRGWFHVASPPRTSRAEGTVGFAEHHQCRSFDDVLHFFHGDRIHVRRCAASDPHRRPPPLVCACRCWERPFLSIPFHVRIEKEVVPNSPPF